MMSMKQCQIWLFNIFDLTSLGDMITNPMNDFDVVAPPDDTVSALAFSPITVPQNFLIAASWDSTIRCWEFGQTGNTKPISIKIMGKLLLDTSKCKWLFMMHPLKLDYWIKSNNYACLMTGSRDRSAKFWDTRSAIPMRTICLYERCYCADVDYPIRSFKTITSLHCTLQKDENHTLTGYAVRTIDGRHWCSIDAENFTFKHHRLPVSAGSQDVYAINDMSFHPVYGILVTPSEIMVAVCIRMVKYALGYDWSKGHGHFNADKKNSFLNLAVTESI
uniref:Peroxin-7 n=1 Tax=Glossina palpalis gambiensis TaxID=67801 RepID=A0A1B0ANC6_9MUSC